MNRHADCEEILVRLLGRFRRERIVPQSRERIPGEAIDLPYRHLDIARH